MTLVKSTQQAYLLQQEQSRQNNNNTISINYKINGIKQIIKNKFIKIELKKCNDNNNNFINLVERVESHKKKNPKIESNATCRMTTQQRETWG